MKQLITIFYNFSIKRKYKEHLNRKIKNLVYYSNRNKYSTGRNFRNEQTIPNYRDKWISCIVVLGIKAIGFTAKAIGLAGDHFSTKLSTLYSRWKRKIRKFIQKRDKYKILAMISIRPFWQIEQRARIPSDQPESLSLFLSLD